MKNVMLQGLLHDSGSRFKAENELRETKNILEDIAQGIDESILLLSKDYKIVWANNSALKHTGLSMGELIGNHCYRATHGREHICEAPDPCPVSKLLETGLPTTAEHEHLDRGGNKLIVEVSAYPVKDSKGDIVRFVHISKDITERKKLEQEREKLIRELKDALAEISTLKGMISICASCKKVHTDSGCWEQVEVYISDRSEAEFTHSICPDCAKKMYPRFVNK